MKDVKLNDSGFEPGKYYFATQSITMSHIILKFLVLQKYRLLAQNNDYLRSKIAYKKFFRLNLILEAL